MRKLTDHKLNGLNEAIDINVMDEPGQGGACHVYQLSLVGPDGFVITTAPSGGLTNILFQNGPIKEAGVNGVSQEALLAVLIDRLRSFQAGPYACRDNDQALAHLEIALFWLQNRTRQRLARGVEGTNVK